MSANSDLRSGNDAVPCGPRQRSHSPGTGNSRVDIFSRIRCRGSALLAAAACIAIVALLIGRRTGILLPAKLTDRGDFLDNDLCYLAAKWIGLRGSSGMLVRAFTDSTGTRSYKLVNLVCRDHEGREVSRVVNGNGIRLLCHPDGAPGKLEMFVNGLPTPYTVLWSEAGHVKYVAFVERDTGKHVYWSFLDSGELKSAEKRPPDDAP